MSKLRVWYADDVAPHSVNDAVVGGARCAVLEAEGPWDEPFYDEWLSWEWNSAFDMELAYLLGWGDGQ